MGWSEYSNNVSFPFSGNMLMPSVCSNARKYHCKAVLLMISKISLSLLSDLKSKYLSQGIFPQEKAFVDRVNVKIRTNSFFISSYTHATPRRCKHLGF